MKTHENMISSARVNTLIEEDQRSKATKKVKTREGDGDPSDNREEGGLRKEAKPTIKKCY